MPPPTRPIWRGGLPIKKLGLEIRRTQKALTEATEGLGKSNQQPARLAA